MSEPTSISNGIAARYAQAIFEIASDNSALARLEKNVGELATALDDSADLREMISSPVVTRAEQDASVVALAKAMELSPVMTKGLRLMAEKRRLFVLPQLLTQLRAMIAEHKGEVTAEVIAAQAMSDAQQAELAETLKARFGKNVTINMAVDDTLIGGLIVKVGSKMIDTSIRSKLNALQNTMKEVG